MNTQELIDSSNRLVTERIEWDRTWEIMSRLVLPLQDREFANGTIGGTRESIEGWASGTRAVDKLSERFDITAVVAAERLATGLISLVTPDNEKWQDLGFADPFGAVEPNDEEVRWLERQRDYLFSVRYNPAAGWNLANAAAFRSLVVFGLGAYFVEEAYGRRGQNDTAVPCTYTTLPLSENYFTVDGQNNIDQDYRRFRLSARAAASLFGTDLSAKTQSLANDPQKSHQLVEILHWIGYRRESGNRADPARSSLVESVYIEVQEKHEIRRGGFSYWPVVTYHWNQIPHSPYGESPVSLVMSEVRGVNILAKNALLSAQQLTRPPVATMDDAAMGKPNLNPAAINYGALDAQGRLKVQPIITAQSPSLIREIIDASRQQIKEGLYTNLWTILIDKPQMTATEALIRANEKAELLGPVGTKLQQGLSKLTEAELTIIEGKGAWRPGAVLEPPETMVGREVRPQFNSPLDRLRRSGELIGIQRTLELLGPLAQMKPAVLDKLDEDKIAELAQEINGAPRTMFRLEKEVAAIRAQRIQTEQAQQAIDMVGSAGEAAQQAIPAAQMAADAMNGADVAA